MSEIDHYLRRLERKLRWGLSTSEIQEALREVKGHLIDHARDLGTANAESEAVRSMGSPKRVAGGMIEAALGPSRLSRSTSGILMAICLFAFVLFTLIESRLAKPVVDRMILMQSTRYVGPLLMVASTILFRRRFGLSFSLASFIAMMAVIWTSTYLSYQELNRDTQSYNERYSNALVGEAAFKRVNPDAWTSPYHGSGTMAPRPIQSPITGSTIPVSGAFHPFQFSVPSPTPTTYSYELASFTTEDEVRRNWIRYGDGFLRQQKESLRHFPGFLFVGPLSWSVELAYLWFWHASTYWMLVFLRKRIVFRVARRV